MSNLLTLLIVAAALAAPIEQRYPDAVAVYSTGFESEADGDFDDWPDNWVRRRGPGFPHYLAIRISQEACAEGQRCFRLNLDGGAALVYSPPVRIDRRYSYVLEVQVRPEGLQRDDAFVSLVFLDAQQQVLEAYTSERVRKTDGWVKLRLGPVSTEHDTASYAMIGLHVEPTEGVDLRGAALFDDLWLARLPRLVVDAAAARRLYTAGEPVALRYAASGLTQGDPRAALALLDAFGEALAEQQQSLVGGRPDEEQTGTWQAPIGQPGFYRVQVSLLGDGGLLERKEVPVAVLAPAVRAGGGEFGWSITPERLPVGLSELAAMLDDAGVDWVKLPIWFDAADEAAADELVRFADGLSARGIGLVGVVDRPPEEVRRRMGLADRPAAVQVLRAPVEEWYPSLEPVLARLSLKVRAWQLGRDGDTSFAGFPLAVETVGEVKRQMDRIGQDVQLAVPWSWTFDPRSRQSTPWRWLSMSAAERLSGDELARRLSGGEGGAAGRWVGLVPLDRRRYSLRERIVDLVGRMTEAKVHSAGGIFLPEPFDDDHGVMNEDGTVGELLLAWRTTALALGGARYLGQLRLPGGSHNRVFSRGGEVVVVAWSDEPRSEVLYLGDDVRVTDVWGRTSRAGKVGEEQVIELGPLPVFVSGVNEAITRLRLAFRFARPRLPSVFGQPHENACQVRNFFGQAVEGRMRVLPSDNWKVTPDECELKLGSGEELTQPFELTMPLNATTGPRAVRVEFDIVADRRYVFSAYDQIDVGLGDVLIEIASQLGADGALEVVQRLVNHSDEPVSFRCHLFAPNRRRVRGQVLELGRGQDVQTYRIPDGRELIGKVLWLRAEEIGGPRMLSYRFVAGQPWRGTTAPGQP